MVFSEDLLQIVKKHPRIPIKEAQKLLKDSRGVFTKQEFYRAKEYLRDNFLIRVEGNLLVPINIFEDSVDNLLDAMEIVPKSKLREIILLRALECISDAQKNKLIYLLKEFTEKIRRDNFIEMILNEK